jgi:ferric-dicitrate binding protein FerR (iron transport regulator)
MEKRIKEMLAGYVDGELSEDERMAFELELQRDHELRSELEEFKRLKEVTGMMHYADLPDEVWESYWQSLYRKTERGIGWILLSVGAIFLLCFGLWQALTQFYLDPDVSLFVKMGVSAAGAGLIVLLVSLIRERLFAYHRDRYKEVKK